MADMPRVNPEILTWARETAGLSTHEAAKKLDIRPAYGLAPPDRLTQLEGGERDPTRPMLVKMAKAYRRPLVVFYLANPPRKAHVGTDFRRHHRGPTAKEPLVQALLREAIARQSIVRDVLLDDDARRIGFVGSMTLADGHEAVVGAVRDLIGPHGTTVAVGSSAFDALRGSAEKAGVFVLLQGDLGSYQTDIDTGVFRGLALADDIAPFVVVNDNDARTAWSFTLVHEIVHLFLGETGVSDSQEHTGVEQFCDDVASEYLLPKAVLSRIAVPSSYDSTVATIAGTALARR
jgi:transcriptional regulator with XRE-family HTH domain